MNPIPYILLVISATCMSCSSTLNIIEHPASNVTVVGNRQFQGAIFADHGESHISLSDKQTFSPSLDDIRNAERILSEQLRSAGTNPMNNQGYGNCPVIHRNLRHYIRQYFGYMENGKRIIFINFLWDRYTIIDRLIGHEKDERTWKESYREMLDGCSRYWKIKVNLDERKLFDLMINGSA